jgi:hypothetical protein
VSRRHAAPDEIKGMPIMITKSDYFRACMNQSVGFLRACLTEPSSNMRPIHSRIIRLALRKKTHANSP